MIAEIKQHFTKKKSVLVLCTGNSCRSQMAEGLFRSSGEGKREAHSAGSVPSGDFHPLAIRAISERGSDISAGQGKLVSAFKGQELDRT